MRRIEQNDAPRKARAVVNNPKERYRIASLSKALHILNALAERVNLNLTELSEIIGQPKSSTFRLLATLESEGYVEFVRSQNTYYLGDATLALGQARVVSDFIRRRARPFLQELCNQFGETVNLAHLHGGEVVYLDMVESLYSMRMEVTTGSRGPVHATALGKAIAAWLPEDEVLRILHYRGMLAITPRTITEPAQFLEELRRVREQGYAIDNGEVEQGARCVAVSVLDRSHKPIAAISVSGPEGRVTKQKVPEIGAALAQACESLSQILVVVGN